MLLSDFLNERKKILRSGYNGVYYRTSSGYRIPAFVDTRTNNNGIVSYYLDYDEEGEVCNWIYERLRQMKI